MFSTFLFPRCLSLSLPPKVYEDSLNILCIKSQGYWRQCIGSLLQNQKGGCQCLELALRNHSVILWMPFSSKTLIDVIVTACNGYAITCSKRPQKVKWNQERVLWKRINSNLTFWVRGQDFTSKVLSRISVIYFGIFLIFVTFFFNFYDML